MDTGVGSMGVYVYVYMYIFIYNFVAFMACGVKLLAVKKGKSNILQTTTLIIGECL